MNARHATLIFLLTSVGLSFLSGVVEYMGYGLSAVTAALGFGSIVCVIVVAVCAARYFRDEVARGRAMIVFGVAALPFVVGVLLALVGSTLNVHGVALPTFLLYALTCELIAAGMTIYLIVRYLRC